MPAGRCAPPGAVESLTRTRGLSLSGRMIYPLAALNVKDLPRLVADAPQPAEPQPPREGPLHRAVKAALVA